MSAHHPLGPSSLARRAACPGSLAAEAEVADQPEQQDDAVDAGNARHAAGAAGLRDPHQRPALLAGLAPEDQAIVESWWGYWDRKVAQVRRRIRAGVEARIELIDGRFGTCDAYLLWQDDAGSMILTVPDLKGQPPGRARHNLQLADYAAGILGSHDPQFATLPDGSPVHVEVALVSRAGIDEHEYEPGELAGLVARIRSTIAAAKAADAPRTPGDHCAYCRAAEVCPTRRGVAATTAALVPLMRDPVAALAALEPERRTEWLDRLALAVDKLGEAHGAIREAIREGRLEVPGYRAIPSSRTEWTEGARFAVLAEAAKAGVDVDELTPLVSVSKAKALLGAAVVDPLTEKRPGTPSVRRMKGGAP